MRMTGQELKQTLNKIKMSQEDLAEKLKVRPETVWHWIKGKSGIKGSEARAITSIIEGVKK